MIKKTILQIEKSLDSFTRRIAKDYKLRLVHPALYESIREFSLRKGKRLRPLLLILSYKGYLPVGQRVHPSLYNSATCIELLHNFMLIHDDIIDRSNLRRGKPTLHRSLAKIIKSDDPEKLGIDLGIITGDIIYAFAIDAFLLIKEEPRRKERALKYFIQTAAFTAMGEFVDTLHGVSRIDQVHEKDVFLNYSLKTARYTFDCPLVTGAILSGAPNKEINQLSKLGIMIGQAFQIQDDIIGIFETEKNIGKSILSDLAESKKTLLVSHAYNELNGVARKNFTALFSKPQKTYKDLLAVRKIFIETGSLAYCLNHIQNRINKTKKIIDQLTMRDPFKSSITKIIYDLFGQSQRIADANRVPLKIERPS
jgi:geranylgeranyl diphosphate synthase, type I